MKKYWSLMVISVVLIVAIVSFGNPMLAYFTSVKSISGDMTAGKLEIKLTPDVPMTVGNMAPDGKWKESSYIAVENSGSLSSKFKLYGNYTSGDAGLYDKIDIRVKKGTTIIYEGPINTMVIESSNPIFGLPGGVFPSGGIQVISVELKLNKNAKNPQQEKTAVFEITAKATNEENPGYDE